MSTANKARKPRPRPARSVQVLIAAEPGACAAVELTVGKRSAAYLVTELAADFGRGFLVEKAGDPAAYHVNIDGAKRSCECKGFLHHGHCKHADGLAALIAAGRL